MPSPAQLSQSLRQDESDFMRLRRWVIGLSLFLLGQRAARPAGGAAGLPPNSRQTILK